MRIYILNDTGRCGHALHQEATARGWFSRLFEEEVHFERADYMFLRISQEYHRRQREQVLAKNLHHVGVKLIPDIETIKCYEDKLEQSKKYRDWFPPTQLIFYSGQAENYLETAVYPFLSKSRTGSASRNVRMISTEAEARAEIETVFHGDGIGDLHKLGEPVQRNYLIWQTFFPGNDHDYRAVITGRHVMLLRRFNKEGTVFASGSGHNEPVELNDETEQVYHTARLFFQAHNIKWGGIDLVQDKDSKRWYVLETTLGWSQGAYANCRYLHTDYFGRDIWKLLCDEIEDGVFA